MQKITILMDLLPSEHIGGAELQTAEIAKRLSNKYDVTVITRRFSEKRQGYPFNTVSIKVPTIPVLRGIFGFIRTKQLMKSVKSNITLVMKSMPNGLIAALSKNPYIIWIRGEGEFDFHQAFYNTHGLLNPSILYHLFNKYAYKKSRRLIVQSEAIKDKLSQRYPSIARKISIIPNGIEPNGMRASGSETIYVGRLVRGKGIEHLIKATGDKRKLIIIGDGPHRRKLEEVSGGNVTFTGNVHPSKIKSLLKRGRIFVLPSTSGEGLPNVILEAMSVGLPVIATKVGGVSDVVKHGKTGFVIKPGDTGALADYIDRLYNDSYLWKYMSDNCVREVKKYSWQNIIPKIESILKS
ncbi:MAG: glycosyltransferase family 4 protein [archaeon]